MTTLLSRPADPTHEVLPEATSLREPRPVLPEPTPVADPVLPERTPVATRTPEGRLVLTGALTGADAEWLEPQLEALVASGHRTVEVELSGVRSMDAAVARLLLRTSWHLGDPHRALLLLHPRPQVHRVLRFVGAGGLVVR